MIRRARFVAHRAVSVLLVAAASATAGTRAADDEEAPQGPTEVIEVRERADRAADATAFATVIRPEDFAGRITSVTELLRAAVGVQVRSLGGQFATVSIRGSSAEQVMVYLDGIPLNSAHGGAVNLADLPLPQIDSIEIYRGFTPASLPSASIGGAIVIHSKSAKPGAQGEASVTAGSWGNAGIYGSLAHASPRGEAFLGLDAARGDDDFAFFDNNGTPLESADDGESTRVNNDFQRGHLLFRGALNAGRARVTFGADLMDKSQGVPGVGEFQSTRSRYEGSRLLLSSQIEAPGFMGGRLLLRGGLTSSFHDEEFSGSLGDQPLMGRSTDNRIASLQAEAGGTLLLSRTQALSFLVARRGENADLHNRVFDPSSVGRASRDLLSATLEDQMSFWSGRLVLNPTLRYERYAGSFEPGPSTGVVPAEVPGDSVTTGRLGFRVDASPTVTVRGNAGTYLRLPDVTELFGDQGSIKGSPDLQPERGRNADLGVALRTTRPHGALRQAGAEAVLFETVATDLILYVPVATGTVTAQNIGKARIRGVELSFDMALGRRLSGSLNAVRQWAVDISDRYTNGRMLPGRPRDELSAGAGLLVGRGRAAYDFTYVGPNSYSGLNTEAGMLPARYLHDLSYRLDLPHHCQATFQVRNLFDEHNVDVARFPLPGRSFEVRLLWSY